MQGVFKMAYNVKALAMLPEFEKLKDEFYYEVE